MPLDLTPFGFTSTENLAYRALLELGPSSAYSVARRLTIARANAYQALDGLVTKGAASMVGTNPRRYRATQAGTLLAQLVESQARKLDRLEQQIASEAAEGERPLVWLTGTRAVLDAATRAILRSTGPVTCLGPSDTLEPLGPAIRARLSGGKEASVWTVGPAPGLTVSVAGEVPEQRATSLFSAVPLLLLAGGAMIAMKGQAGTLAGYWGEDPLFRGLVMSSIKALTT